MTHFAYKINSIKFPSIRLELRVFGIFRVEFDQPPSERVTLRGTFFAIFDLVTKKYSDTQQPSLAAARGWLQEISRLQDEKMTEEVEEERHLLCQKLATEVNLFLSHGTTTGGPYENKAIEQFILANQHILPSRIHLGL